MKILVVQESDWLLRGPHQQHHLIERMALKGHEVRVIDYEILWRTRGKRGLFSRRQVFEDVTRFYEGARITVIRPGIVKIPVLDKLSILFSHIDEIKRQLDEFKPDVVVGFGILNTYFAMKLAKERGVPFVYYLIDTLHRLLSFKPYQLLAKEFEKWTLSEADRVITINRALMDYAVEMGAEAEKSSVLGAGIDLDRFNPDIDGSEIRTEYGIAQDDIILFFMGWMYEFSGLREVALGLAKNKDEYPNVRLMIVGEGDLYDEIDQIREKYECTDRVILTGQQPYEKIPAFVSVSDVCLLPAYNNDIMQDIVPIKMYEYMACGKPIISTDLNGIRKEFGNCNGILYADSPEGVLDKAKLLINDDDLMNDSKKKGVNYVSNHNWVNITKEYENILNSVILRDTI